MTVFWVIGGKYSETHLQGIVGSNEELIGPFRDYEEAVEEWTKHAGQRVEHGSTRYLSAGLPARGDCLGALG